MPTINQITDSKSGIKYDIEDTTARNSVSSLSSQMLAKVDKAAGKSLSSNDYTDADKEKLNSIKTVATTGSYKDLLDKPEIPEKTKISEKADNALSEEADGFYVPKSQEIKISEQEGNVISEKEDGLFVPSSPVEVSKAEDNAVTMKSDGLFVKNVNSVDISKEEGNQIEEKEDGIFVPATDISGKVDKVDGKSLSANDFSDELKDKLDGIDLSLYIEKEEGKSLINTSDINQISSNKDAIDILNADDETENSVRNIIKKSIGESLHLTKQIIDHKPTVEEAKENILYLVPSEKEGIYKQYTLIENKIVDLDNTEVDIVIDDEMSETSENPVQNKVIYQALFENVFPKVENPSSYLQREYSYTGCFIYTGENTEWIYNTMGSTSTDVKSTSIQLVKNCLYCVLERKVIGTSSGSQVYCYLIQTFNQSDDKSVIMNYSDLKDTYNFSSAPSIVSLFDKYGATLVNVRGNSEVFPESSGFLIVEYGSSYKSGMYSPTTYHVNMLFISDSGRVYVCNLSDTSTAIKWTESAYYSKPAGGIPKTDLDSDVQSSLGKADTALQSETYKGTVTSVTVKMNGTTKGTITSDGTIDLGTVITSHQDISGKVDKVDGKGLSANDFSDELKDKLDGIATGAEVNVQSDWNVTDTSSDAYIKNKPTIPDVSSKLDKSGGTMTGALSAMKGLRIPTSAPSSPQDGDIWIG